MGERILRTVVILAAAGSLLTGLAGCGAGEAVGSAQTASNITGDLTGTQGKTNVQSALAIPGPAQKSGSSSTGTTH